MSCVFIKVNLYQIASSEIWITTVSTKATYVSLVVYICLLATVAFTLILVSTSTGMNRFKKKSFRCPYSRASNEK